MQQTDIPVLAGWIAASSLWQRYGLTVPKAQAMLEQGLSRSDSLLVAAADEACGLAWCLPQGAFGRSAYLRLLGVNPAYTGLGIGATLLNRTEQIAAESSVELFLLVSDFNIDAQRFYQRHGYTQIGTIPGYVLPDVIELLFWKRL